MCVSELEHGIIVAVATVTWDVQAQARRNALSIESALPSIWGGGGGCSSSRLLVGLLGKATVSSRRSVCVHSVSNKCHIYFLS